MDTEAANLRIQAYNMYQQDRSRTPEDWFAFLTADTPEAPVLTLAPPYDQDADPSGGAS